MLFLTMEIHSHSQYYRGFHYLRQSERCNIFTIVFSKHKKLF